MLISSSLTSAAIFSPSTVLRAFSTSVRSSFKFVNCLDIVDCFPLVSMPSVLSSVLLSCLSFVSRVDSAFSMIRSISRLIRRRLRCRCKRELKGKLRTQIILTIVPSWSPRLLDSSGRWRQYPRQVTNLMLTCLIIARFTRSSHNHGQSNSLSNRFELTT